MYSSLVMILGIISTLKYELAIMLADKKEDAANLLFVSLIMTLIVSIVLLLLIWLLFDPITQLLGEKQIGN